MPHTSSSEYVPFSKKIFSCHDFHRCRWPEPLGFRSAWWCKTTTGRIKAILNCKRSSLGSLSSFQYYCVVLGQSVRFVARYIRICVSWTLFEMVQIGNCDEALKRNRTIARKTAVEESICYLPLTLIHRWSTINRAYRRHDCSIADVQHRDTLGIYTSTCNFKLLIHILYNRTSRTAT